MSIFGKLTSTGPTKETVAPAAPLPASKAPAAKSSAWGIDEAIKLVRSLPFDSNPELVAWVMKNTLASMNINIDSLVDEATSRQDVIRSRIASLHAEIGALEVQLSERRAAVMASDAELAEMSSLRRRLDTAAPPRPAPLPRQSVAHPPQQTVAVPQQNVAPPAAPAVVEVIEEELPPRAEMTAPPGSPLPNAEEASESGPAPVAAAPSPVAADKAAPVVQQGKPNANRAAEKATAPQPARNAGVGMKESPYAKS